VRVVMTTYDSRGGVEPLAALAVRLQEAGAEAVICAPPDCEERLAELGVPLVALGGPVRALVHGPQRPPVASIPEIAATLIAEQFDKLAAAVEGCDVLLTSGVMSAVAGARSVAELLGIRSIFVSYCPIFLPSPHHPPQPLPGRPFPPGETDRRVLDVLEVESYNALFGEALNTNRAAAGLPPVDDVRAHILGGRLWLAADPVLGPWRTPADLDVVQTGAWSLPDQRALPTQLERFLDAGSPPVHVGFGSMRAPEDFARIAIEAVRAQGRRAVVGHGWADLAPIDDRDDCFVVGEVNQQALFTRVAAVIHHGGAGTTATAARAGAPQVVVPQIGDQPYWAGRVAALGIGAAHDGPSPTVASLSSALRTALAPDTRSQATAVAGTIRTDGAEVAARLLLDSAGWVSRP
jgi:vancomycin aglycone glucosyltransferase